MTRTKEKDTEKRWAKKARWEREREMREIWTAPFDTTQSFSPISAGHCGKNYFWCFFQLNGRNRKRKKRLVKKSIHEIGILRLRAGDRPRAIRTFRTNIPEVEVVHWMLLYLQSRQWWGLLKARRRFRPPDGRTWSRRCRLSRLRTFQCFSRQKKSIQLRQDQSWGGSTMTSPWWRPWCCDVRLIARYFKTLESGQRLLRNGKVRALYLRGHGFEFLYYLLSFFSSLSSCNRSLTMVQPYWFAAELLWRKRSLEICKGKVLKRSFRVFRIVNPSLSLYIISGAIVSFMYELHSN